MVEKKKSDLEPMKVCPRCGNETSVEVLSDISGCYFCGNIDFSEEAYHLPDDSRTINCSLCGRLVTSKEIHSYNPMFYKFSKKIDIGPFEFFKKIKIDVGPFDWINLCIKCQSQVNVKLDFTIIKKIIDFHGSKKSERRKSK